MQKENIIITSLEQIYDITGYSEELESPLYKLKSVTVEFSLKQNQEFKGTYNIITKVALNEEEIKDKIIEALQ